MEPISPETRESILRNNPEATPADIQEYDRLLSRRFRSDPDAAAPAHVLEARASETARLTELYQKLFTRQPTHKRS